MRLNIHSFIAILFITLISGFCTTLSAAIPADTSISPMLQKVLPAVVNIRAQIKITDFATLQEIQKKRRTKSADDNSDQPVPDKYVSVGSGVIVDADNGYILTNAHVINDAQTVTVTLGDSRHYTAKIIGLDKPSDIALLQIKAKSLTSLPIGDSNLVKVGDFVAAIGNPFGLSQTVTSGVVSALGRTTLGIENYENFIQTDAPINMGNSGGALVNMKGELIGINTAILAPDRGSIGIGFAIPANMAKSVMMQFIKYGDIRRGLLGVGTQTMTPELASAFNTQSTSGAAITQVLPGSPAQQAGLQEGDIITAVNNSPIKNANDVINTVAFLRVDSKLTISILRNNKSQTINVSLTDPKKRTAMIEQADPFLYGVTLKNFSVLTPVYGTVKGILVINVEEDSRPWNSDLRAGDVITSVNQKKVTNIEELKAAINKSDQMVMLHVLRGPAGIFLVINKEP